MFSFSINTTGIIDCTRCDAFIPLPTCFLASCFRDPLSQCWSLPAPPSLSLSPLLAPFFLSAVCSCLLCGMLFINLTTMTVCDSRNHWQYSVFFDDILVSRSDACVCHTEREAPDCAVCLCAAGLVCMKSSTSVVELVMLLCSQVGNSSPPTLLSSHNT